MEDPGDYWHLLQNLHCDASSAELFTLVLSLPFSKKLQRANLYFFFFALCIQYFNHLLPLEDKLVKSHREVLKDEAAESQHRGDVKLYRQALNSIGLALVTQIKEVRWHHGICAVAVILNVTVLALLLNVMRLYKDAAKLHLFLLSCSCVTRVKTKLFRTSSGSLKCRDLYFGMACEWWNV